MDFKEWFKERHTKTGLYEKSMCGDDDSLYLKHEMEKAFKAGQQSKQAEIDSLKAELAKYQKDGYKLIPVEPSKEKLKEIEEKCFEHPDCFGIDCPLDVIYRAIVGEVE